MALRHAHHHLLLLLACLAGLVMLGAPPLTLLVLPGIAACALLALLLHETQRVDHEGPAGAPARAEHGIEP
ncbi:hypothetical protein [Nocardia donostiensis]|uniref:Uncharacterized protein n=1 Tax=Nocardia donostiensis TaxID=1538463 RepID=A0A1W0BGS8_9NOCA|nr:hypothetical protein [Nocardia donostiensis]ONM47983.1 hypothetical protein B0T46_15270 [Nocardia donostiensis]OQS21526.1 hypothetical protein B0T44_07875 [Nocardia donostiensis]